MVLEVEKSWDDFVEKYAPIDNTIAEDPPFSGKMFETFGAENECVLTQPVNKIWTVVSDDQQMVICPGYKLVNRLGLFITTIPWKDDEDIYIV
jgi:hypothetical protein